MNPRPKPLRFAIRTPEGVAFEAQVLSARVPTETGLVGLRPGGESLVLSVEPGLVVLRTTAGARFAVTAGGLLESEPGQCTLLSPFALAGDSEERLERALAEVMAAPPVELRARHRLEELEQRILGELARRTRSGGIGASEGSQ